MLAFDLNCHSDLFGSSTNRRGEDFEIYIVRNSLFVENVGISPTFKTFRGNRWMYSNVDVTLSRGLRVVDWFVDRSYNGRDHNSVSFKIDLDPLTIKEVRPWSKAKWKTFYDILNRDFFTPELVTLKKVDKMIDYLYKTIEEALDLACPKHEIITKLKSHWFNDSFKELPTKDNTVLRFSSISLRHIIQYQLTILGTLFIGMGLMEM